MVEAEGLEPTNSEETRFTVWRRCRLAILPVAHRTCGEGILLVKLKFAYEPSVTLDYSFAGKAGIEPATFTLSV